MKKIKRILSLILTLCMICGILTLPVHAEYCCTLNIDSIVQSSDKLTINFTSNSVTDNRTINISLSSVYHGTKFTYTTVIAKETLTVSSGEQSSSVSFDSSVLIPKNEYRISLSYKDYCDSYSCRQANETFFAEYGMPVYEIGNTFSEDIVLEKGKTVALKVTASQKGIYDLSIDSEDDWCLHFDCMGRVADNAIFLQKDQTAYYEVYVWSSHVTSCTAKFKSYLVPIETKKPLTENPSDNSTVYSMTDITEIVKIEIPKRGQYTIYTECENSGDIKLLNDNGEDVASSKFNKTSKHLLDKGTYYFIVNPWSTPSETYTTTIKYVELPQIRIGDTVSYVSDTETYAKFKLDKKTAVWFNSNSDFGALVNSDTDEYYISTSADYPTVLDEGEYILSYRFYDDNGSAVLCGTEVPIVTIGDTISPLSAGYNNHIIFKAPQTAEYEFYFPDGAQMNSDSDLLSYGYYYLTMQAGETVYFKYDATSQINARKFVSAHTSANIGETTTLNIENGQKTGFKFTADADDFYHLALYNEYGSNANLTKIKVYTDSKVLYEGENAEFKALTTTLKKK